MTHAAQTAISPTIRQGRSIGCIWEMIEMLTINIPALKPHARWKALAHLAVLRASVELPAIGFEQPISAKLATYRALADIGSAMPNALSVQNASNDLGRMIEQYQNATSTGRSSSLIDCLLDSLAELSDLLADMMTPALTTGIFNTEVRY